MRFFDFFVSLVSLVVLCPLFVLIALAIKLDSPGAILYQAKRSGRYGVIFHVYKFRTMVEGADRAGPGITIAGDSRITRIGQILRRTKLDELPQLLNVLKGEMSLVGPRPEDPRYVAHYTEAQRRVLDVRPGITSPASIYYHDESAILRGEDWEWVYINEVMPHKLSIELDYLCRRNILRDLGIILHTFFLLLRR